MKEKKYIKSVLVVVVYVIAVISFAYAMFQLGSTIKAVLDYGEQAGQAVPFMDAFNAILQGVFQPLIFAVLLFMSAKIYDAVRMLNPKNYATEEELAAAKLAKLEAKQNKAKKKDETDSAINKKNSQILDVTRADATDVKMPVVKPEVKPSENLADKSGVKETNKKPVAKKTTAGKTTTGKTTTKKSTTKSTTAKKTTTKSTTKKATAKKPATKKSTTEK